MTNICVIGGGPAGMYTSKYLLTNNYNVTLYEKSKPFSFFTNVVSPFTTYTFNHFNDTLSHNNFKLKLGKKINIMDIEHKYDAFVIATGAPTPKKLEIQGAKHCVQALTIAKNYFRDKVEFGRDVLVVGCGNVAMDMVRYLFCKPSVEKVTVLARKGPFDVACTNTELMNVYEMKNVKIMHNADIDSDFCKAIVNGKNNRRKKIFKMGTEGDKKLQINFYTNIEKLERSGERLKVDLVTDGKRYVENFDTVISAIGFKKPQKIEISTKPVFYVGWCRKPSGSLADIKKDALAVTSRIINYFAKQKSQM